jgi:hypothetical protein
LKTDENKPKPSSPPCPTGPSGLIPYGKFLTFAHHIEDRETPEDNKPTADRETPEDNKPTEDRETPEDNKPTEDRETPEDNKRMHVTIVLTYYMCYYIQKTCYFYPPEFLYPL